MIAGTRICKLFEGDRAGREQWVGSPRGSSLRSWLPRAAPGRPAGRLFGTAYQGSNGIADLYQIDPTTGGSTVIGSTGFERVGGIDFDPLTGQLYGFGERDDGSNEQVLITIDPTTGAGTEVGPTNIPNTGSLAPTDLSFRSDGTLFAFTDGPEQLHTLDLMTGAATLVGNVDPFDGVGNAIAFDPTDLLFWAGGNDGR